MTIFIDVLIEFFFETRNLVLKFLSFDFYDTIVFIFFDDVSVEGD